LTKTLLQRKPANIKQGRRDLVLLKRTALTIALILALLVSAIAVVLSTKVATANPFIYLPIIVINSDGSVEPENDFIAKTGNTYTLTANLSYNYVVNIQRSNIIFDGAGHIINGTLPSIEHGRWFSDGAGLSLEGVTNVTVRNIEITGFNDFDVVLENSRACYFFKMKADDGVVLENSNSNLITECNLAALTEAVQPGIYLSSSNSNKFYRNDIEDILLLTNSNDNNFLENNFVIHAFLGGGGKNVWDNGSFGNYWNDYLTKYPNASEIGNSGIGDTPYVIDVNNIDHYPLLALVDNTVPAIKVLSPASGTYNATSIQLSFTVNEFVSQIAYSIDGKENITITGNITLTVLVNGVHDLTIYAKDKAGNIGASETIHFNVAISEPFPVLPVAAASVAAAVVGVGLLVYFRKRKKS
jgi:hypothetical protein